MKLLRNSALALAGCLALAPTIMSVPASAEDGASRIVLVLDASGSMKGPDPSGLSKMEAAKRALSGAVEALPLDAEVGLRVYGATQPGGQPTPEACADTQLVHPVGPLDKAGLQAQIAGFEARGETPIAHSLAEAAKDLGAEGKRHIILVSDGEESCVPDPCPSIQELVGQGIDLQIDTVGFGVDDTARKQLQCIADAGKGTYYDAKDAAALESSLRKMSQRAARGFTVQGTPVRGTPTPTDAPVLRAGQYTDSIQSSEQGAVDTHYAVRRTQPGSTLRVNVVGRLPHAGAFDSLRRGSWIFDLSTRSEKPTRCENAIETGIDVHGAGVTVGQTLVALPLDPRVTQPRDRDQACADAQEFDLRVTREAGDGVAVPVEIRVIEEPAVSNADNLPAGVAELPGAADLTPVPLAESRSSVIGGASFNDALAIAEGSYETEIVPGELVFFKVPLEWGEAATVTVHGPDPTLPTPPGTILALNTIDVMHQFYAPDLSQMVDEVTSYGWNADTLKEGTASVSAIPQIQYRNRWDSPALGDGRGFAMAGDYYIAVGIARLKILEGVPVPVRFSLAIEGEPQPGPQLASSTPATPGASATTEASASTEPSPPAATAEVPDAGAGPGTPPLIGGSLMGAAVLGAVGYLFWRRRSGLPGA